MFSESKTIIVPWDFTDISKYALEHAVNYARVIKGEIVILHIVKSEEEINDVHETFERIARENEENTTIKTSAVVRAGSIFHTITQFAEEIQGEMVIMGTHGIKGNQKYFGSRALKVIANTQVPFMVIQDPPVKEQIQNILYPINFKRENKESLTWIIHLAKIFTLKIVIYAARYNDKKLKTRVHSNIVFAQNILNKKSIPYELQWAPDTVNFANHVIDFSQKTNPDAILIMITRNISLADFLFGANEQHIIANRDKIPVICLSPRPLKNVSGFMAGGG